MVFPDVVQSVGRTPLLELRRLDTAGAAIFVKMESRNPCGSVKDRVGGALVEDAEKRGLLKPGAMLVEPTSGNTGIALAFVAAAKGYKLKLTMPEHISQERVGFLRMLGAKIVFTPGVLMREAVKKAEEIAAATGAVMLQQFRNPANPEIHRRTTAEEIWTDMGGEVDVLVAGVGTGGTITGVGEVLKARRPGCRVVAVEPAGAAVLSGRTPGSHHLPGLGAGFVPEILNRAVIDEIVTVTEEQAVRAQLELARREGLSAGMSSGAALHAALGLARRPELAGKRFVVILPDGGERYATNAVFVELARNLGFARIVDGGVHAALARTAHRPWPVPRRPWIMRQSWRDLLFAHWPLPAATLRALVPRALAIQEWGGTSWVGLVPFRMEGVSARLVPDLPELSVFPEMNLRLYVEAGGKPGVWFVSLDAANRLAVWGARRFFHLPYFRADMTVDDDGAEVRYSSVRRGAGARVALRGTYRPTADVARARPGTLEHFLTERYCLYAQRPSGALSRLEIHHEPWPLQAAAAEIDENTVGDAQGVPLVGPPALLHFSRRLDVVAWCPEEIAT